MVLYWAGVVFSDVLRQEICHLRGDSAQFVLFSLAIYHHTNTRLFERGAREPLRQVWLRCNAKYSRAVPALLMFGENRPIHCGRHILGVWRN